LFGGGTTNSSLTVQWRWRHAFFQHPRKRFAINAQLARDLALTLAPLVEKVNPTALHLP
jgi:hypothetical protein